MTFTIRDAARELRDGRATCVDLLHRCLARIDAVEPKVRAWVLVDRDRARAEAEHMDDELRQGRDRGPLHGIPVAIKDIIDVFDWPTACGSALWKHSIARQDAPVVRRLREAGAVLIGKTVTTAYASFDPPITKNPWNLSRTPGGSSSGSAAAVATRMCYAALGSQTGGSITRPASYCGVPGMKPTYGAASTDGVLTLAASMDHMGPIGRCVHDLALMMQAISDPGTRMSAGVQLSTSPVLGRLRGLFDRLASPDVRESTDRIYSHYVGRGANIVEVELPAAFADVVAQHRIVMAVESAQFHAARLARHPDDYPPNITTLLREGIDCSALAYARAKECQQRLRGEMQEVFAGLDALICPATTRGAPDAATTGDPAFNSPWSFTGLPVVSIPTGLDSEGLPLGIQLVGAANREGELLAIAAWCEANRETDIGDPPLD